MRKKAESKENKTIGLIPYAKGDVYSFHLSPLPRLHDFCPVTPRSASGLPALRCTRG